jgi:hypothetical protein
MKEAGIGGKQAFIPHDEAPKVPQPGEGPFDDPAAPLPPQLAPILMRGVLVIAASRDHGRHPPMGHARPQGMAVIAALGNRPFGPLARPPRLPGPPDSDHVERLFKEANLRWGSRLQVGSQRRSPCH